MVTSVGWELWQKSWMKGICIGESKPVPCEG
jgi:hypothetical protein